MTIARGVLGAVALGVILAAATAAAPGAAVAQERMREARAACGADAKRLCDGVRPGGGRLAQCLKANEAALSPPCRTFLQSKAGK